MSVELGQNHKVYVANATSPYTYTVLAGQRELSFDASTQMIDTSSKSSSVYGQQAPGRAPLSINVTGVLDLPDANGIERVYTLFKTQAAGLFRLNKTDVSPVTTRWQASMYVSNWRESRNDQNEATYSFTLTMAATGPTTDDLTP